MPRSIPIWIADSPDYTQGQESPSVDGDMPDPDIRGDRQIDRDRVPADGGEQPALNRRSGRGDRGQGGMRVCEPTSRDGPDALRALRDQIEEVGRSKEPVARVVLGAASRGVSIRFGAVHEWMQLDASAARADAPGSLAPQSLASESLAPVRPATPTHPSLPPREPSPRPLPQPPPKPSPNRDTPRARHWTPPLTLLAAVACEAMRCAAATRLVWIGRRVFPYPVFLARQHPSLLAASLFVDVRERDARVWAIDVALRSGVPVCVIADGQGITLAESRRLQVAAKCGRGVALLARPAHEAHELSAAASRWVVTPRVESRLDASETDMDARVAWTLTLVRSKGESLGMDAGSLIAEWRDAQGLVVLPALVASRANRKAADAAS